MRKIVRSKRKDKRYFVKTAKKTKAYNVINRGGKRL